MIFSSSVQRHTRAFTLIELVVVIAIFTYLIGAAIAFHRGTLSNTRIIQSELGASQQIRKTFSMFSREARGATQSSAGAYAIDTAGTSTFIFYSNIDDDIGVERIRYFLATTTLMKGIIEPIGTTYGGAEILSTLIDDVSNGTATPVFTYYDGSYDGITASSTAPLPEPIAITPIRLIKITIKIDSNGKQPPVERTHTTEVSIRNLKDNL